MFIVELAVVLLTTVQFTNDGSSLRTEAHKTGQPIFEYLRKSSELAMLRENMWESLGVATQQTERALKTGISSV